MNGVIDDDDDDCQRFFTLLGRTGFLGGADLNKFFFVFNRPCLLPRQEGYCCV
jgi:hypothetical protein